MYVVGHLAYSWSKLKHCFLRSLEWARSAKRNFCFSSNSLKMCVHVFNKTNNLLNNHHIFYVVGSSIALGSLCFLYTLSISLVIFSRLLSKTPFPSPLTWIYVTKNSTVRKKINHDSTLWSSVLCSITSFESYDSSLSRRICVCAHCLHSAEFSWLLDSLRYNLDQCRILRLHTSFLLCVIPFFL